MRTNDQHIILVGSENSMPVGIDSSSVSIFSSIESSISSLPKNASNYLMVSPAVCYDWEYDFYLPKLVASHPESGYIAYFIKAVDSRPVVRIINRKSRSHSLVKDFTGNFITVEFSLHSIPLLAVLSLGGCLKIFSANQVSDNSNAIVFSINLNPTSEVLTNIAMKWGPVSPSAVNGKNSSLLISVALDKKVYLLDINGVLDSYITDSSVHQFEMSSIDNFLSLYGSVEGLLSKPCIEFPEQSSVINTMAFSCDALLFATGAHDGKLTLYKTNELDNVVRCFREWHPHSTYPLCSVYFVSSKTSIAPSGYLITAAKCNQEFKVWRMHNYSLVQTLNFNATNSWQIDKKGTENSNHKVTAAPQLITFFDATTNLLLASDIKRTVLYVLDLNYGDADASEELAFRCINELLLVTPCIAFDVSRVHRQSSPVPVILANGEEGAGETIEFSLALIHPKMLQTGRLCFTIPVSIRTSSIKDTPESVKEASAAANLPAADNEGSPEKIVENPDSPQVASPNTTIPCPMASRDESPNASTPAVDASLSRSIDKTADIDPIETLTGTEIFESSADIDISEAVPAATDNLMSTLGESLEISFDQEHIGQTQALPKDQSMLTSSVNNPATPSHATASLSPTVEMSSVPRKMRRNASRSAVHSNVTSPSRVSSLFGDKQKMHKTFDSTPNMDTWVTSNNLTNSPHASEVNSIMGEPHRHGLRLCLSDNKGLSDSVRSLIGSSSCASLASSCLPNPSSTSRFTETIGAPVNAYNGPPTTNTPSMLMFNDVAPTSASTQLDEVLAGINTLMGEYKTQTKVISTLMNKVQENKNQLAKVINVQNAIVAQLNVMSVRLQATPLAGTVATTDKISPANISAVGDVSLLPPVIIETMATGGTPVWANNLMDQVRSQKADTSKRLTQMESVLKSLQQKSPSIAASGSQVTNQTAAGGLDSKQLKAFTEQIRGLLRIEVTNVFKTNTPKIVEPVRASAMRTIADVVRPMPNLVADQMMRVLNDPKFAQYLSGHISAVLSPNMAMGYREEMRRILVPAFSSGVDKLVKDVEVLLKNGLNRHLQLVSTKVDETTATSKEKMDVTVKQFDECVKRLSKDFANSLSAKVTEGLKSISVADSSQPPAPRHDSRRDMAQTPGNHKSVPTTSASINYQDRQSNNSAKPVAKQLQRTSLGSPAVAPLDPVNSEAYFTAVSLIHSGQHTKALESALTKTNLDMLLKVLNELPVVQLFRQNVGQDLLLSLIHQLSFGNLRDCMDLKISFLQEAVNHLKPKDDMVVEFGGNIISLLVSKLSGLREQTLSPAEENRVQSLWRSALEVSCQLPSATILKNAAF